MRHSASSLETWQNCPRLWRAKYIDKVVPYVEHPAAKRGTEIHEKLEKGVETGAEPEGVWTPPGLIAALHKQGAGTEVKAGVNRLGESVDFFSDEAKLRGVMDVYAPSDKRAVVIDWKTGKVRPKKIQADTYTVFVSAQFGRPVQTEFYFVYVDQRRVVPLRRDPEEAQARIFDLIAQVEADTDHLPQPGWLCRFCDYYACRYNENPDKGRRDAE